MRQTWSLDTTRVTGDARREAVLIDHLERAMQEPSVCVDLMLYNDLV